MASTDRSERAKVRGVVRVAVILSLSACSTSQAGRLNDGGAPDGGLSVGQPCSSDTSCQSGICLGNCCASPCNTDPNHPECSACDVLGACQYPSVQCIAEACDPSTKTANEAALCSNGLCVDGGVTVCPGSCEGTRCGSGCEGDQDCSVGYRCLFLADGGSGQSSPDILGVCAPQESGGQACLTSDDCLSGYCLDGVCCNTACPFDPAHPECAYCDATGACIYPSATCLPAMCDLVSNSLLQPSVCANGMCPTQMATSCQTYRCLSAGCATTCLTDGDCASSAFCVEDNGQNECCPIIVNNGRLYVDLVTGTDQACCGTTQALPCQTIARALEVARLSAEKESALGLAPVTRYALYLTIDGGPTEDGGMADWQSPPRGVQTDSFPLTIPDGVTLHAPGIELGLLVLGGADPAVSGDGGYYASLEGEPGRPMFIGLNAHNSISGPTIMHLGGTLDLSNVVIFGGMVVSGSQDLAVSTVMNLGLDSSGNVGGPVQFGWDENQGPLNGTGIIPKTQGLILGINLEYVPGPPGGPMLLTDYGNPGDSVLRIYNQGDDWNFGLQITKGVKANLTHGTVIGGGHVDGGYGGIGGIGNGGVLILQGATIENQSVVGVLAANGLATIDSTTLTGNGCYGVVVGSEQSEPGLYLASSNNFPIFYNSRFWNNELGPGGALRLSRSTVRDNFIGVVQDAVQGTGLGGIRTELSFDADGGPGGNEIACNDRSHGILDATGACTAFASGGPGGNVWNRSFIEVSASAVAWGPVMPSLWTCDGVMTPVSCSSDGGSYCSSTSMCPNTPLPAVQSLDNGMEGTLVFSSATLAAGSCP